MIICRLKENLSIFAISWKLNKKNTFYVENLLKMNYNGSEKYSSPYATRNPEGPKYSMFYIAVFRVT